MIESLQGRELIDLTILALPLLGAFSKKVRMKIGKRDNWTCQIEGCDKSFQDGFMVFASHKPDRHSRDHPLYNDVSSGEILCIDHEQERHELGTSLGAVKDAWAVEKLKTTDRKTWKWREEHDNLSDILGLGET